MKNLNSKIGKFFFALTIIAVLFRNEIGLEMNLGGWTFFMTFGLFLMFIGFVLDDLNRVRKIKSEEKRRQEWIRSLYRK